jgi:hypothetical protein
VGNSRDHTWGILVILDIDLLFKPSQMLLDFSALSLKGVYDLLNTRQRRLLIERDSGSSTALGRTTLPDESSSVG